MRFTKGESGNPAGRPKGTSFAAVLARQLERGRNGLTTRDRIAAVVVGKALDGDLEAVKWIADRVDGRTAEKLEASVDSRHEHALAPDTVAAVLAYYAAKRGLGAGET